MTQIQSHDTESASCKFRDAMRQIASISPETTEQLMTDVQQVLSTLYQEASNPEMAEAINGVWSNAQTLATINSEQHVALIVADVAISAIEEQRNAVLKDLKDLLSAIENNEWNHPKLENYAQAIREDIWEDVEEYALDDAHNLVYENMHHNIAYVICENRGLKPDIFTVEEHKYLADRLTELLLGGEEMTPHQKALFMALIDTLESEENGDD